MSHSHDHSHHTHSVDSFNFSFAVAVGVNLTFTLIQIFFALYANSMSLLADAVHNFGDVFGLVLAWGANWLMSLPARKRYSYGFKRTTIIAALINALILVATSAVISYQSVYKLFHLKDVNELIIIVVATIGIIVNGSSALLFMKGYKEDLNIKGAFLHLIGDAVISGGVVLAGILIYFTHWYWLDPLTGLLIVLIVLWGTWGLLRDSVRLILDAIPHNIDQNGIETFLKNISGVTAIHDLHIWGLSTREIALTAHLTMPEKTLSDADFLAINKVLKCKFKIDHATLQVEKGSLEHPCSRTDIC